MSERINRKDIKGNMNTVMAKAVAALCIGYESYRKLFSMHQLYSFDVGKVPRRPYRVPECPSVATLLKVYKALA